MPKTDTLSEALIRASRKLSRQCMAIDFGDAAPWIYNPLQYAKALHEQYLERFARPSCQVLFLGMNPGPWGMSQTGVPFGEIAAVRDYLKLDAKVKKPNPEHPKRPIEGLDCPRSEVSGRRLWGLFAERHPDPEDFFADHFVSNFCPLVFMEESARNITPDKLPAAYRSQLQDVCDAHLTTLIQTIQPNWIIGVGAFAETCAKRVVAGLDLLRPEIGRILHPSPASPAANKDWAGTATRQLTELGIWA
jgi:single-strand selective monofunctional uracil DNA glycosylase